jgi:predicted amidophosphoribosyltransferase
VPYQRLLAGWLYLPPCDRVITALKFRGLEYLGGELAQSLAERYRAELADCDLVVPVPLHWGRRWRRGYNQAEKIASRWRARSGWRSRQRCAGIGAPGPRPPSAVGPGCKR